MSLPKPQQPFLFSLLVLTLTLVSIRLPACTSAALPDTQACCRRANVPAACVTTLCDVTCPPNEFAIYEATGQCGAHLATITGCLADGRNHSACCWAEAHDGEQSSCFDFCDGSAVSLNQSASSTFPTKNAIKAYATLNAPYLRCLDANGEAIYRCLAQGYRSNPGPPRRLVVSDVTQTQAELRWDPPMVHPLFADMYRVLVAGPHNGRLLELTTRLTGVTLSGLQPDTRFLAHVVASSANGRHQSLRSNQIAFVTLGVAPLVVSYEAEVCGGGRQTLVSRITVPGEENRRLTIIWQRRTGAGHSARYRTLRRRHEAGVHKYSMDAYADVVASAASARHYVSALSVHNVAAADYGIYRCVARNAFGNASADIRLRRRVVQTPDAELTPAVPPNVAACCKRAGVHPHCLSSCTQRGGGRRGVRRSKDGVRHRHACVLDVPKLLACSVQGLRQGACCLRRRVPTHCLALCDMRENASVVASSSASPHTLPSSCLRHTPAVLACQLEAKRRLPSAPNAFDATPADDDAVELSWHASKRADVYNVFYRSHDTHEAGWQRVSTPDVSVKLTRLRPHVTYDVLVVAANGDGNSEASKTLRITGR